MWLNVPDSRAAGASCVGGSVSHQHGSKESTGKKSSPKHGVLRMAKKKKKNVAKNISKVHRQCRKHAKAPDLERKITRHGVRVHFAVDVNEAEARCISRGKSGRIRASGKRELKSCTEKETVMKYRTPPVGGRQSCTKKRPAGRRLRWKSEMRCIFFGHLPGWIVTRRYDVHLDDFFRSLKGTFSIITVLKVSGISVSISSFLIHHYYDLQCYNTTNYNLKLVGGL